MDLTNKNSANDGLITKIWGPSMWESLHSITFAYPINPTKQDKENYRKYFELVGEVLPCSFCRESYKKFITTDITKLDDNALKNRESLTKWLYYVHEAVNDKLGVDYGITYSDVVKRFESYRASCNHSKETIEKYNIKGCDAPVKTRSISFNIANNKTCPLIPKKIARHFVDYAKLRGLSEEDFAYINDDNICKNENVWDKRNRECRDVISHMRLNGISSLETEGEWVNLPTVDELKLILRFSSNLSNGALIDIIKKLPNCKCQYTKIYKVVK